MDFSDVQTINQWVHWGGMGVILGILIVGLLPAATSFLWTQDVLRKLRIPVYALLAVTTGVEATKTDEILWQVYPFLSLLWAYLMVAEIMYLRGTDGWMPHVKLGNRIDARTARKLRDQDGKI